MKFIRDVKLIAIAEKAQKLDGPVELNIIFHPRLTRRGQASLIRQDLSNTIKVTEDALQGVAYTNDNQIVSLNACISNPIPCGGLTVSWSKVDQIFV